MGELRRIRVDEVSLAKNPANRRKFFLLKEADPLEHHLTELVGLLKGQEGKQDLQEAAEFLLEYVRGLREELHGWKVGGARNLPLLEDDSWDADQAVAGIRRWASGEDGEINFAKYRRAFIIYDSDAPDNLTSYRFPFAKVVDGELRASRMGLITAKRMAAGARRGSPHPMAEEIIAFVNSYLGEEDERKETQHMEEKEKEAVVTKEIQELQKEIEELKKRAEEAEKRALEERELRIQKEYEEKAEQYASLGIEKATLVKMMRTLDEAGLDYRPHFDALKKKVEEAGLYKEFGVGAAPGESPDFEKLFTEMGKEEDIVAKARELARKNAEAYALYRKKLTERS